MNNTPVHAQNGLHIGPREQQEGMGANCVRFASSANGRVFLKNDPIFPACCCDTMRKKDRTGLFREEYVVRHADGTITSFRKGCPISNHNLAGVWTGKHVGTLLPMIEGLLDACAAG